MHHSSGSYRSFADGHEQVTAMVQTNPESARTRPVTAPVASAESIQRIALPGAVAGRNIHL
jgi:hypothetical protein